MMPQKLTGAIVQRRLAIDGHFADIVSTGTPTAAPALLPSERFEALFALTRLLNGTEHKLLFVVAWRDGGGRGFYGAGAKLAALTFRTGCSRRSLQQAAQALVAKGLIVREPRHRLWRLTDTFASASAQYAKRCGQAVDKYVDNSAAGVQKLHPQGCKNCTPRGAKTAPPLNSNTNKNKPSSPDDVSRTTNDDREGMASNADDDAAWCAAIGEFAQAHPGSEDYLTRAKHNMIVRTGTRDPDKWQQALRNGWRTHNRRRWLEAAGEDPCQHTPADREARNAAFIEEHRRKNGSER